MGMQLILFVGGDEMPNLVPLAMLTWDLLVPGFSIKLNGDK